MASEDIEFNIKQNRINLMLGQTSLPVLLAASLEAGHSHYITPTVAIITTHSPIKYFEVTYTHHDQQIILRNLLIDVLWEVYREG